MKINDFGVPNPSQNLSKIRRPCCQVPRRVRPTGNIPAVYTYRGGVRRHGEAKILNFPRSLGAMLAPFFDLGCFLSAFCVSCCVCCRPWPVFERLEALQRRFRSLRAGFWRVSRGRGVVFGAPGVHFSALLQACTLILGKSFQCIKTIVFPRFFQVFHISRAFCAH